ncbi:MAG: prolipoprotein diacylglyceryl transferase [Anaerolineaceae bacterium]|jgi:phosphatidylglycerol:prolipoprotein diacylglycerol transferase
MPQGFNIGPITIRYYALIIILGAVIGAYIASKQAKRAGKDPDLIIDVMPWLLISGIIGSRLWHVFTPSASNAAVGLTTKYYLSHPLEILMMWKGGLGIPGGVIFGVLALWIWSKARKLNFFQWADFIAPGLAIAQAVGRWGNFINQELYGGPSNLPWAIKIDPQFRLPGFEAVERYHPLFLYESLLNFAAGLVLIWVSRKYKDKLYKGDIFILYLILYPSIRFFMEFLRLDPSPVAGLNINQTVMGIVALLAVLVFLYRRFVRAPRETDELEMTDMLAAGVVEREYPEYQLDEQSNAIAWPELDQMAELMLKMEKK